MELVEALKKAGRTYEFFHFPDEQHGIRRPDNYVNAYARMEAWFDKYLKADGKPARQSTAKVAQ